MWTRIKSITQIKDLPEGSELLHEPEQIVYKLKKIEGDVIIVYQSGSSDGRSFYATKGFPAEDLLNGDWASRKY